MGGSYLGSVKTNSEEGGAIIFGFPPSTLAVLSAEELPLLHPVKLKPFRPTLWRRLRLLLIVFAVPTNKIRALGPKVGSMGFDSTRDPPNCGSEDLAVTPQLLRARALRYRHLATRARTEACRMSRDPIAPRLIELAEKLEGDAVRDEEEARVLLSDKDEATPGSLPG
jgi:hypothetical protein